MKFAIIATLLPLAFSAAVSLEERATDNTQAILSGFSTLEADITKLDTLVKVSNPDIAGVQNQEQKVEQDITSITNLATSSSVATDSESTSIYNEIKNNLQPKINTVLTDLVNNKAAFASVKAVVQNDLNKLNNQTGTLGNALIAKATGSAKTNGPALIKAIQDKFAAAIKAYA